MARAKGGPARKAPGMAVDARNGVKAILSQPGERYDMPHREGDVKWHTNAVEAWEDYWKDPVSSLLTETDRPMLYRWIDCVDRYWRLMELADESPMLTTAANGQVANGLYRVALQSHASAMMMETRLGISPKSRASLGIQILEAHTAYDQFQNSAPPATISMIEDDDPRMET